MIPKPIKVGFIFVIVGGTILLIDTFTPYFPAGSISLGIALAIAGAVILNISMRKQKRQPTFKTDEKKDDQIPKK